MSEGDVQFEYERFQGLYPELASWATPMQGRGFWDIVTGIFDNTNTSLVQDLDRRRTLLYLLTAHVAQLNSPLLGPSSAMVGRVSSVSEGSVSLSADWAGEAEKGEAFYLQTKYGSMFWAATRDLRLGRYYPGPQRFRQGGMLYQWPFRRW